MRRSNTDVHTAVDAVVPVLNEEAVAQLAAAAEVEPVDAHAEVSAAGLDAVPREHTDPLVTGLAATTSQRLDLTVGTCEGKERIFFKKTSSDLYMFSSQLYD